MENRYLGTPAAVWLLFLLTFVHTGISLVAIFRSDGGAQSADGIPLNTFSVAAAQAVIGVVAFLGLEGLWLALTSWLVLLRYRAAIPLMYLVWVVDWLAHRGIGMMKPIVRSSGVSPGAYVTWSLLALSVVGLVLSLTGEGYRESKRGS